MDNNLPVTIEDVKGRDLPKAWAERAGFGPNDTVRVTIGPARAEIAADLMATMKRVADALAAGGYRPDDILRDIPDFPRRLIAD